MRGRILRGRVPRRLGGGLVRIGFIGVVWAVGAVAGCAPDRRTEPEAPPASESAAPAAQQRPEASPTSQPAAAADEPDYEASEPATLPDGHQLYGGALDDGLALTALSEILDKPASYADQRIKTQGTIERVCKVMGCWMELSVPDGEGEIRAPMAGHGYFLPQSVVGKSATVEGVVRVRELDEAQRKHLAAEGAKATSGAVSLEAAAVALP